MNRHSCAAIQYIDDDIYRLAKLLRKTLSAVVNNPIIIVNTNRYRPQEITIPDTARAIAPNIFDLYTTPPVNRFLFPP